MIRKMMTTGLVPRLLLLAAMLPLAATGCASDKDKDKKPTNKSPAQARAKGEAPDKFEASAGDPPLTADTRFAAGQLAESQGDAARAITQYRAALKIDPNHRD